MEKEYIYNPMTCSIDEINGDGAIKEYVVYVPADEPRYPLFDGET